MPGRRSTHPDVEYHVGDDFVTNDADEAAGYAFMLAVAHGESELDVVIFSRVGAKFYGGDDAAEQYDEDPDASVFDRFELKVNALGRVP